jgi:hypothetical protein
VAGVVRRVGLVVVGALLLGDLVLVASLVLLVVSSLTGSPADDPHGYARIFGVVMLLIAVPIGLVLLVVLRRLTRTPPGGQATRRV